MAVTIETKEIGIPLGIDKGTFNNTEYISNSIQLKEIGRTDSDEPVYVEEGYWESEVIDLVDKFREYDKVALSKTQDGNSVYAILTKTSDDGINFTDYIATTPDGKIQAETKRYIQIKIVLYAGFVSDTLKISSFDSALEVNNWNNTSFVEMSDGLKLKKNYSFEMIKDTSWDNEGSLLRKTVNINDWKKINSLTVDQ
ncbi:hypothetical protein ABE073_03810 [Lederbergia citrisecunda]|uniref:hypothetical protein n=1 Tax=Lederbergia citrisecunda TaxID=2833583 RepID=UPI003D296C38